MGETVASDGGVLQSAMEGVDGTPVLDLKPLLERTRESQ
jgi:tRNA (Thr-GGU) A37 N-methylase